MGDEHRHPTTLTNPRLKQVQNMDTIHTQKETETNKQTDVAVAKVAAQEKRKHQERPVSISSTHSVQSRGIGGGGPLAFTQYQNFSASEDEDDNTGSYHHYDKGIGAHGTPTITKKPYNGTSITTWF